MARRIRNVLDRRAAIGVALALTLAAAFFAGAAIFSVNQRAEQDQQTCNAVIGLRNDLVEVVKDGEKRGEGNINRLDQPEEVKEVLLANLHDQTAATLDKINNPDCP